MKITRARLRSLIVEEVERLLQEMDVSPYPGQAGDEILVSPGLKVRHRESNLRYTVVDVNGSNITLRTPTGDVFVITMKDLEGEYKLD